MPSLKIITINVELDRHWKTVLPFLEHEEADVICLQECFDHDVKMVADKLGYQYVHLPMTKTSAPQGVALLSKTALKDSRSSYYYMAGPEIQTYQHDTTESKRATVSQGIIWGTLEKDGGTFTVGTTHFTWTADGSPNQNQKQDIASLVSILKDTPELILCGDFNVPRGTDNEIYNALTQRFKDNIPAAIRTTIDIPNHRVRHDPVESQKLATFVVDYIFSTPEYLVTDVRCDYGLSDHCAVTATISRAL